MSKQSEAKEKQGFKRDCTKCSNCKSFTSDIETTKTPWGTEFNTEKNLRCSIGNFKVGKSNWCKSHEFKTE